MKQWGIGSTSQKVAQTVGSILTGLVTGNAGQAVAGGLNPWAAQLIKKETTDASGNVDVATNAMAHAVWGAVSSQMSGGSAAAGAAGAFSGELATRYIAEKYWGADTPEKIAALGQEDREQLSLLGTLAAGLAGGMAGNSSAAATSGAIAGKNAVENNAVSGIDGFGSGFWDNNQAQGSLVNNTNLVDETGKVLNPATPEEIKYVSDKLVTGQLPAGQNAATGLLTAWGAGATTVVAPVLLPATATAGSVIGAAANVFIQMNSREPFSATDALIATGISGVTQGKGFWFTEAASITGAYVGASLQGKDAAAPMIGAGLGTLGGATIGKGVDKLQTIIPQFTIPKITGAVAESAGSEYLGSSAQNLAEKVQQKLEKKSDAN
ncbi:VENN motif pre-toxin domain-containing protein [Pantoea vagans]|uniref:VENN motif pre-toxin domain-containing protein n=1 Tax=Pantoea vagans TaxID=470934 RepID=UPI000B1AEDA7|nr:VENN motif pre-toxin domain-containing protein [Pantoea vagans]AVE16871.1 adhesin [Pantoea vagans]